MFKLPALTAPNFVLPTLPAPGQLAQKLPLLAARQLRRVPFSLQRRLLQEGMGRAFQEPIEDGDFEFLEGRWLKVEITDVGLAWFISYDGEQLLVARDEFADATIRGNLKEFLLLASRSEDPDSLFFQRRLMIEGDTEVGLEAKNLMDGVDQEQLPKAVKLLLTRCAELAQRFL